MKRSYPSGNEKRKRKELENELREQQSGKAFNSPLLVGEREGQAVLDLQGGEPLGIPGLCVRISSFYNFSCSLV